MGKIAAIEIVLKEIGLEGRLHLFPHYVFHLYIFKPRMSEDISDFLEPQVSILFEQSLQHLFQIFGEIEALRELELL